MGSEFLIPQSENRRVRSVLLTCLKVLVSGFLVWFLLNRIGIENIGRTIARANAAWLLGGVLLFAASHILGSAQWQMLLYAEGIFIPYRKCLSIYFVGSFFNNFLVGHIGGDVFRIYDVRRISKRGTAAVSAVFLDRFVGLLTMSGIAVASIPFAFSGKAFGSFLWICFAVLISGWCFSLLFLFRKPFARRFAWIIPFLLPRRIETKAREVYNRVHRFGEEKALLCRVVLLSTVVQAARIFTHYLLARALGIGIGPAVYFLVIPIVAMAASLPISLGGIGLREQTGALLLGAAGVAAAQAVSVEFLAYLTAIFTSLPGGAVFVLRKMGKGR